MTKELIQKFLTEVPAHPVPKTKICVYDNRARILYLPDGTQKAIEKTVKLQNDLKAEGYEIEDTWGLSKNDHPFRFLDNRNEYVSDMYDFCGKTIIEPSYFRYCPISQKWLRTEYRGEEPRYLVVAEDKEIWYNDRYLEPHQPYDKIILPEACSRYGMGENLCYGAQYQDFRGMFYWGTNGADKKFKTRFGCEYIVDLLDKKYLEV